MKTTVGPCVITEKSLEVKRTLTEIIESYRPVDRDVKNDREGSEDLSGMDVEVESWHREAVKLRDFADSMKIESQADLALAADDLSVIVRLKKAMMEKRQFYTGPFDERIKAIDETYRELMAPVEEAEKITRNKMSACRTELHKETMEVQ